MDRVLKPTNYLKSILIGMSSIVLPVFFQNQDIPRIEVDSLTDRQKVQLDYSRSLRDIKREAAKFGYKEK